MKYFVKIFAGCTICFIGVMAGLQFAKGNIIVGISDIFLALTNFPAIVRDF